MKAQRVCRVKAIPVAARATRISALWLGVAALTLAIAALPAEAGKKQQKPAKAPDEPIVAVDNKQPMIVVVSIGQQKVDVYRGTTLVTTSAVSTGTAQHPTFIGAFSIMQKARWHHSNIYSGAPMPWMNRLTWSGTAMHAGVVPGYPASHGCIRLTYAFAPKFFQMSSVGDNVITSRGRPKPTPVDHPALFQPLPPPSLPEIAQHASLAPLQPMSSPVVVAAAAAASPVILARAEAPTTVDSEAQPQAEQKAEAKGDASQAEPAKDTAETHARPEADSDPNRVHAITPDTSDSAASHGVPDTSAGADGVVTEKSAPSPAVTPEPEAAPTPTTAPTAVAAPVIDPPVEPASPPPAAGKLNAGVDAASVEAAEPHSQAPLRILLTRRTQRDRIIGVQEILASTGYLPPQKFDGTMGKATIGAIKEFQKANGMGETGAFNDELVKKVYAVADKGEPPAGHLYVRQEFDDVFDTAVSFRNADEPLGTHVYVALNFAPGDTKTNWVTLDVQDGGGAAAPLDRLEIPDDVRQKISERLTPGSTFIVADTSINSANLPRGGDFVVLAKSTGAKISMTDDEPEARPKPRRRNNAVVRRFNDDPWGGAPWSGRNNRGLFGRGPW
ncbi:L,D-transpeptidase family protein [Methyloceanibacter sp.]|uniref:L,D-transpeptidase family protein n=1 Tax=Methyloceanibacter sp. TaxID=1965321 RepID=UPI003D6C9D54